MLYHSISKKHHNHLSSVKLIFLDIESTCLLIKNLFSKRLTWQTYLRQFTNTRPP